MASEFISPFLGTMPRLTPEMLQAGYAQLAKNCRFDRGVLEPEKGAMATGTMLQATTKTIYWFNRDGNSGNGFWLEFPGICDVLRGQIANDQYLRTYIFGDGAPKYTTVNLATTGGAPYPSITRQLGLPVPDAPTATAPSGEPPEGGSVVSAAYVITYVSDIGEEGPPSLPSSIVERWDGAEVALSGLSVPSGNFEVVAKRIYRAEMNGSFQYVGEIPSANTTFADSVTSEYMGEPVPSSDWDAPHSGMVGAINAQNGVVMGWWGNTLAFCEPYMPHAWPASYQLALDFDVIGAAVTQSGIVVCTNGKPYLITGSSPAGMAQNPIDTVAACVSRRSIVDMGEFALYAGSEGLIAVGGTQASVITSEFMTPEQWRLAYNPSTLVGAKYRDCYLGFHSGGAFLFKPGIGFIDFAGTARAVHEDDRSGDVYFLSSSNSLSKWGAGENLVFEWKSRRIRVPNFGMFSCAKVDAHSYPVAFKFYADGALIKELSVNSKSPFRLPNTARYRNCEIELSGDNPIVSVQLATAMNEVV